MKKSVLTNAYTVQATYGEKFKKLLDVFFVSPKYKDMSVHAKVAYGFLMDRQNYSAKNGWVDKQGRIYFVYTIKQFENLLGCKRNKAVKVKQELMNHGLLYQERQANQASRLYLLRPEVTEKDTFFIDNREKLALLSLEEQEAVYQYHLANGAKDSQIFPEPTASDFSDSQIFLEKETPFTEKNSINSVENTEKTLLNQGSLKNKLPKNPGKSRKFKKQTSEETPVNQGSLKNKLPEMPVNQGSLQNQLYLYLDNLDTNRYYIDTKGDSAKTQNQKSVSSVPQFTEEQIRLQNQDLLEHATSFMSNQQGGLTPLRPETINLIKLWSTSMEELEVTVKTIMNAKAYVEKTLSCDIFLEDQSVQDEVAKTLRSVYNRLRSGKVSNLQNYLYRSMLSTFQNCYNANVPARPKDAQGINDLYRKMAGKRG
ncbi:replication initiator protein A [Ligilactobacillus equi]|uniref:Replication initiator protein n=1 Tax=Ligilactobacillus equi DSM 15833 = JCM 10991 TaxID=1423740 RepID=A0A0R1TDJ0_9LACO|nr:replication initiator protein A [Ligilactobacillus equi]KRL79200.1 replication initiator protein [Ligilactobacillus equi DSM 15833 = JCM 10991]